MTFDDARAAADQEFGLVKDTNGSMEYGTKCVILVTIIFIIYIIYIFEYVFSEN